MSNIVRDHILHSYAAPSLRLIDGEGAWVTASDGRRYLDFCSGIAVNALGHAHPALVKALADQAGRLWHCSNLYDIPGQEELAKRLSDLSSAEAVFFCNSGVEAWEGAVKFALKTQYKEGRPERWRCITLDGCFHGRSMTAIHASKAPNMVTGFGPPIDGFDLVPHGDLAALEAAITPETAMVCLEPVQGDGGGVRVLDPDYLRDVRDLCDAHNLLLIFDEIQCGIGRTGRFFAHEWTDIAGDIIMSAKGLGGGFPVGAILCGPRTAAAIEPGDHGSTYGGNPLAMAVAGKVVEIVSQPEFLEGVCNSGARLHAALVSLAEDTPEVVAEVRGHGLMLGVKFQDSIGLAQGVAAAQNAGLLTAPAKGGVMRLLPPLNIGDSEIAAAIACLDSAFAKLRAEAS